MSTSVAIVIGVCVYVVGTIINNIVLMREMRKMIREDYMYVVQKMMD